MIKLKPYLLITFILFLLANHAQGQEVFLTWSTDTYVPLEYIGKALPTRESNIEVVSNTDILNPENLFYNWLINDKIEREKSGKGKQVFNFKTEERIREYEIKVRISDEKESFIIFSPILTINPQTPEIILKTKPTSLESFKYTFNSNQEIRFTAQPYFFNIKDINNLDYSWSFGQESASQTESSNPNIFTLKISQLVDSITKKLTVWVEDRKGFLQKAQTEIEINIIP